MDHYERLRERLDINPAGAPPSKYVDQILRILFSPAESEAACFLTFMPQPISRLAERAGKDRQTLQEMYEGMADRGLVAAKSSVNGEYSYSLMPTIPGLFEIPFMRPERLSRKDELAKLWHDYHTEALGNAFAGSKTPLTRVIPVQKSLSAISDILIYEQVSEAIARAKNIAVTNCACRVSVHACAKPLEVCLAFDGTARFLVKRDFARMIDRDEAMSVLDESEKAGLVHCTNNIQDGLSIICNCCGCCCTILRGITKLSNPNAVAKSNYVIAFEEGDCTGCMQCLEDRCPVSAIREDGDLVLVDSTRCIGCGLCAFVCPTGALHMKKRDVIADTPKTNQDLFLKVLQEKGKLDAFTKLHQG